MNQEETLERVLNVTKKQLVLEIPTGHGKSKLAIESCLSHNPDTILVIVPKLVIIKGWKDEFIKWGKEEYLSRVTFSTYAGIHKVAPYYDCIIFDEAHHMSERIFEVLRTKLKSEYTIMLSATLNNNVTYNIKTAFPEAEFIKIKLKEAITNGVLPDPKVYLYPLTLSNDTITETIIKKRKGGKEITCLYRDRWKYLKNRKLSVIIKCTPREKNLYYEDEIDFWKRRYMSIKSETIKNKWLRLAGERLKWLSFQKNDIVKDILSKIKNKRVITFCSSIEQTEILGRNCINSKNKESIEILDRFNGGKINHITACNIINEGVNLTSCEAGLFANLNSSDTIIIQRIGRILRYKKPIIIIPYYKNTREEELVNKMIENYNPELINIINNLNELSKL